MTESKRWQSPLLDDLFRVVPATLEQIDVVRMSPLFQESWYLESYKDVAASGMDAAEHYVRLGALFARDPGPNFSTSFYLTTHLDVRRARMNPLIHYERNGRREGRTISPSRPVHQDADEALWASLIDRRQSDVIEPVARDFVRDVLDRRLKGEPTRLRPAFDGGLARHFVRCLLSLPGVEEPAAALKASVVMPTFNRGAKIEDAIRSVLNQSHADLELLVVDDGSIDNTLEVLARFANDHRVRVFRNTHAGVSAARNTGLQNATGTYVFYLDSDNEWTRDYLKIMLMALKVSDAECAYAASRVQDGHGRLAGYRSEVFDWAKLLEGNYVDMNVFCHRRSVAEAEGGFDTTLRRVVDWDLILRFTKMRGAVHVPIIGCIYKDVKDDPSRITVSQPWATRKIVQEKNRHGYRTSAEALAQIGFNIAIKTPAPYDERTSWGDFHYAESLANALTRAGHKVRIDFRGDWYKMKPNVDDIVIVLRGRVAYEPRPGDVSLLWNISHPDQVTYNEYAAFDAVFVASESYAALLSSIISKPVLPLLQCTDSERFPFTTIPADPEGTPRRGLFVGNSRNEYRLLVRWAVEANVELDVYGGGWEPFLPDGVVKGQIVNNNALAPLYSSAAFVLNDHWESMRDFGFVSNRVYDVLGCGGRLISDHLPALEAMFGDAATCVRTEAEFRAQMRLGLLPLSEERRRGVAEMVHDRHSFDQRAEALLVWVRGFLLKRTADGSDGPLVDAPVKWARTRIGVLLCRRGMTLSEAAYRRIVTPLTTDEAHVDLELIHLTGIDDPRLDAVDAYVVQAGAVTTMFEADHLLMGTGGRPLVVDLDRSPPSEERPVLERLMEGASEVWVASPALLTAVDQAGPPRRLVRDTLDPRIWRDYRRPVAFDFPEHRIRFLYMEDAGKGQSFNIVLAAFDRLAESASERFDLTLIGAFDPMLRPWLKHLPWPNDASAYPFRVRWLMGQGPFDVGLAPAGPDLTFLDYSALGLLSLVDDAGASAEAAAQGLALGCAGTEEAWHKALTQVIEQPGAFVKTRQRANAHLWAERSTLSPEPATLLRSLLAEAPEKHR